MTTKSQRKATRTHRRRAAARGHVRVEVQAPKKDASLIGQFGVGFYRTETDFVEIRPVGKSEFMVWSDCIVKNASSGLLGFFQKKKSHIDKIVVGRESAIAAVSDYMDCSREAFEQKYG